MQLSRLRPTMRIALAMLLIVAATSAIAGDPAPPALRLGLAVATDVQTAAEQQPQPAAQPPAPGQPLGLTALVRIALDTNPLVRAAQEGVAAARESIGVARASYYPKLDLDASYRRFDTHVFLPVGLPVSATTVGPTDDWGASVKTAYILFDSGQRRAERDAAVATGKAAAHDAVQVRQDVVLGVNRAYYRVLSALAARSAVATHLARSHDHLEIARTRHAAGAVPKSDVLRAEVELADAQLAVVSADGAVRVAYGELNTAIGLPVDFPVTVSDSDEPIQPPAADSTKSALDQALNNRPELQGARERTAAANRHVAAVKGAYGPQLVAQGAFGWRDSEFLPQDKDWSAGLSVRVPLFTGFARTHRVTRAATEVRAMEGETAALAARIQQEVWTASSALEEAHQSVLQSEVLRAAAEESLRFARARYEAGAGTIADLLDTESALTQAEASHVSAVFNYHVAKAMLLRAEGNL